MRYLLVFFCLLVVVASNNKYAPKCDTESDCKRYTSCEDGHCIHKGLIPLDGQEIGGSFLILILALLSNAGGVGGSTIMIALLLLIFNFDTHSAIPLAQAIIWGGSIISIILRVPNRHPTKNRPLISWDLVMHISSLLLLGTSIGVMANTIFPDWLILSLLTIVVAFLTVKVMQKGIEAYKKESQARKIIDRNRVESATQDPQSPGVYVSDSKDMISDMDPMRDDNKNAEESNYVICAVSESAKCQEINVELQKIEDNEKRTVLWGPVVVLAAIFGWVVLASFIKGDKNVKSIAGFAMCSDSYWGFLIAGYFLSMLIINTLTGIYLVKRYQKFTRLNYDFDEFDMKWDAPKVIKFSIVSIISGVLAGLLGIGSGLIVGPVMLSFGIRPEVSAANSSVVIFLTSSISMILYIMANLVDISYALWFGADALLGAAVGILLIKKIVIRKKRASILVLILAAVLLISLILIPTYGIMNIIDQNNKGTFQLGFKDYCA